MSRNFDVEQDEPQKESDNKISRQIKDRTNLLETVFLLDRWLFISLGFNNHLASGMPPKRIHDWDFNENYEQDRIWITHYASDISYAHETLLGLSDRLGMKDLFLRSLDFDPLKDLRPTSPLNEYRDRILGVYDALISALTPENADPTREAFNIYAVKHLNETEESRKEKDVLTDDIRHAAQRSLFRTVDLAASFNKVSSLNNVPYVNGAVHACIKTDDLISGIKPLVYPDRGKIGLIGPIRGLTVGKILYSENYREEKIGFIGRILFRIKEIKPGVPNLRDIFLDLYCDLVLSGIESKS